MAVDALPPLTIPGPLQEYVTPPVVEEPIREGCGVVQVITASAPALASGTAFTTKVVEAEAVQLLASVTVYEYVPAGTLNVPVPW